MDNTCQQIAEKKKKGSILGEYYYEECGHKAKYEVTCDIGIRERKLVTKSVCKQHRNMIKRIMEKFNLHYKEIEL